MNPNRVAPSILALSLAGMAIMLGGCSQQAPKPLTYAADIKPILDQHCVECHKQGGKGTEISGLLLDSYAATMRGTKYGPVVIPGQAINSTLYRLITGKADPSLHMPHDRAPLSEDAVNKIKAWIDQGAKEQ